MDGTNEKNQRQGRWSWVRRVRICAPNIWATSKENAESAHPIFGSLVIYCAPNFAKLPPALNMYVTDIDYVAKL